MKLPWKFLTELTSWGRRGPGPVSFPSPDEADIESNAAQIAFSSPGDETPLLISPAGAGDEVADDNSALPPDAPHSPATEHFGSPHADPIALTPVNRPPEGSFRTSRVKPSRGKRPHEIVPNAPAASGDMAQSVASQSQAVNDEVFALDADIARLKKQLSEKLYLQNLQLKRMLERFEGS